MAGSFRICGGFYCSEAIIYCPQGLKVVCNKVVPVRELRTGDLELTAAINWVTAAGLCIPRSVECTVMSTFDETIVQGQIDHVTFESNSHLTRIENT
jgi:hypothetical protein